MAYPGVSAGELTKESIAHPQTPTGVGSESWSPEYPTLNVRASRCPNVSGKQSWPEGDGCPRVWEWSPLKRMTERKSVQVQTGEKSRETWEGAAGDRSMGHQEARPGPSQERVHT